jgi:hypothetical protein
MTSPSLLDVNYEDVPELKTLADNSEALLRIARAEIVPQKKDPSRYNLALTFDCTTDSLVDDIRVWLPIPSQAQKAENPKGYAKTAARMREFCEAFDISLPVDPAELGGKEGWAIVSEEDGQDGRKQNSVRRFLSRK